MSDERYGIWALLAIAVALTLCVTVMHARQRDVRDRITVVELRVTNLERRAESVRRRADAEQAALLDRQGPPYSYCESADEHGCAATRTVEP